MKINDKIKVKLTDIDQPTNAEQYRVGSTDQAHVNDIATSFSKVGQKIPIKIKKDGSTARYKVVDGAHRFFAAMQREWLEIDAQIVEPANAADEEDFQFGENDKHDPAKGNTKPELEKYIRNNLFIHKRFGLTPSLNDLDKVVEWHMKKTHRFPQVTVRALAKHLLSGAPAPARKGTQAYIKGTPQLVNTIKHAVNEAWMGNSVKSVSQGHIVQCISQDSDVTIKPGTSLIQKYNHGAKAIGVVYIGTTEGVSDTEIDNLRKKWITRIKNFGDHVYGQSNGKLNPFDKIVILPQTDSEIRTGVRRLELKKGKLVKFY
jgi:hypothetical protein